MRHNKPCSEEGVSEKQLTCFNGLNAILVVPVETDERSWSNRVCLFENRLHPVPVVTKPKSEFSNWSWYYKPVSCFPPSTNIYTTTCKVVIDMRIVNMLSLFRTRAFVCAAERLGLQEGKLILSSPQVRNRTVTLTVRAELVSWVWYSLVHR